MDHPAGDPALAAAFRRTGLTARELWFRCLALGGNADAISVEAQVYGLVDLPPGEYNVVAHAVNEALDELPEAARPEGRLSEVVVRGGTPPPYQVALPRRTPNRSSESADRAVTSP